MVLDKIAGPELTAMTEALCRIAPHATPAAVAMAVHMALLHVFASHAEMTGYLNRHRKAVVAYAVEAAKRQLPRGRQGRKSAHSTLDLDSPGADTGSVGEEMTTQEAANFLRVSRPFIVKLVDTGVIPARKVGRHRRVLKEDVVRYRDAAFAASRAACDEVAQMIGFHRGVD